jgi:hypothetical protein
MPERQFRAGQPAGPHHRGLTGQLHQFDTAPALPAWQLSSSGPDSGDRFAEPIAASCAEPGACWTMASGDRDHLVQIGRPPRLCRGGLRGELLTVTRMTIR